MYLFHLSERDVSLKDCCTLFSQRKGNERPYRRRSTWKKRVLVQEAYVFQRKNVPLVISAPKGDFALYNKRQELNVVTAVRLRCNLNQNFMDCKMVQTKCDNENISRNFSSQSVR